MVTCVVLTLVGAKLLALDCTLVVVSAPVVLLRRVDRAEAARRCERRQQRDLCRGSVKGGLQARHLGVGHVELGRDARQGGEARRGSGGRVECRVTVVCEL